MPATAQTSTRKRSNGIAARGKILDAAAEIATERGYEGTTISLVSKRSGLPASSIYWHFENKDDLISAVIERSFAAWLEVLSAMHPPELGVADFEDFVDFQAAQMTESLKAVPDFLRLGLMLGLEHHPDDPTARKVFLKVRSQSFRNAVKTFRKWLPDFSKRNLEELASFCIALADGFFISREVADATHDMMERQDLFAAAIRGVVEQLRKKQKEKR